MAMSMREEILRIWSALRYAAWLGWQMESNWARPWLFAVYAFLKPISSTLILIVMYLVITGGKTHGDLFVFMFVGNAFYMFVGSLINGISQVIHSDREHYRVLKYIYISPMNIYVYLFGRGLAKVAVTSIAVTVTLTFGILVFHFSLCPSLRG
ncbi:MAG: hypothetical protein HYU64_14765 [Armatimonadetes bacterium]|nr:hypothetical protein [Armatimonadota bacterium]